MRAWFGLVIVAVLGLASQGTVALQRNESDPTSSRTVQQLFQQYLRGDAEGAVRAFATWDDERIADEAQLLPATGTDLAAALAVFHSEAWLREGPGGRAHYTAAVRLMTKEVCPAAHSNNDSGILGLCRDWYGVVVVTGDVLDYTADFLPDSASVHLARGIIAEWMAGPAAESGGGADHGFDVRDFGEQFRVTSHGRFGQRIADAEASFRRALKIDPHLAEARTRLGRVLFLLDRREEARKELERAFADARTIGDNSSEYLAAMFLARLHEESDRMDEAILAYRRAIAAGPRFPAARVALAAVLAAARRADEATSTVAELFRELEPTGASAIDPWTVYPRGPAFWHRHQIMRTLREVVRRNVQTARTDVTVADDGRPVPGLAAKDVEVAHAGVPKTARSSRSPGQLSVMFALDTSASVTAGRSEYPRKWHQTPENFQQLIAAVRTVVSRLEDGDEVSLITFSDGLKLAVPPTTDLRQFEEATRHPEQLTASARIRSTVWDAAAAAAALAAGRPHRPIVILLSDGTDNASWLSQADAITAAKRVDVPVDLISIPRTYDTQDEDPPGSWDVEAISERTDGEAFSARDRDLSRKIAQRLTALRRRSSPVPSHSAR
jgi:tetratricopeptide (TPR) repeat protein